MQELPRITRSLRMFTNLGRIKSTRELQPNDLFKKEEEYKKLKREFNWQDLCRHVPKDALHHVNKLRQIATKTLGECSYELIDEFLLFTLQLLINDNMLTNAKFAILKRKAANLTFQDAQNMMEIIRIIRERLKENILVLIENKETDADNIEISESKLFGSKIEYKPARVLWPDTETLRSMSLENIIQSTDNFSKKYRNEDTNLSKTKFDKAIYKQNLESYAEYFADMTVEEFEEFIIISKLKNENSEDELLDLLGCESIEFIQYIIEHRKSIIALRSDSKVQKECNIQRPVISGQVTVQSKKEKQLLKQVRKKEKKLNKMSNMRENIPFVFDSNISSRTTAGYVSKQQIMLPQNAVRKDTEMFEEVSIPPPESQVIDVNYKPVMIDSLDDTGQMAFSGIKSLNIKYN